MHLFGFGKKKEKTPEKKVAPKQASSQEKALHDLMISIAALD